MFIKCFCGRCPECRHRKANHKYYAARRVNPGPEIERWSRIYDVKFKDPTYYEPIICGPQFLVPTRHRGTGRRGKARQVARRRGCE